jgi:hypothetical protein
MPKVARRTAIAVLNAIEGGCSGSGSGSWWSSVWIAVRLVSRAVISAVLTRTRCSWRRWACCSAASVGGAAHVRSSRRGLQRGLLTPCRYVLALSSCRSGSARWRDGRRCDAWFGISARVSIKPACLTACIFLSSGAVACQVLGCAAGRIVGQKHLKLVQLSCGLAPEGSFLGLISVVHAGLVAQF